MSYSCRKAQSELEEIKKLKQEFDLELENSTRTFNVTDIKKMRENIYVKIDELRNSIETFDLIRRAEIAKKHGFYWVDKFKNGFASCKNDCESRISLVNEEGTIIASDIITVENAGLDVIGIQYSDGDYYLVNKKGEHQSACLNQIDSVPGGFLIITPMGRDSKINVLVQSGKTCGPYEEARFLGSDKVKVLKSDERWYILDSDGQESDQGFCSIIEMRGNEVMVLDNDDHPYIIDSDGNLFGKESKYTGMHFFSEGIAVFQRSRQVWGFVDKNGNEIGENYFSDVSDFHEGLAKVKRKVIGYCHFINKDGDKVGDEYLSATDYSNGYATVKLKNGIYCLIDKQGKIFSKEYSNINHDGRIGLKDDLYYFIDDSGNERGGFKYMTVDKIGRVIVGTGTEKVDSYYFVDELNNKISGIYDEIGECNEGMTSVRKDNKWYFIDRNFKLIGDGYGYDKVDKFKNGLAQVKDDEDYYFIDRKGKRFPN